MKRVALALAAALLLPAATAFAGARKPTEYRPPQVSEEELAMQRARAKNKVTSWTEDQVTPEKPFPWMFVGLAVIALLASYPFAMRYLRQTEKEIVEADAYSGDTGALPERPATPSAPRRPRAPPPQK